MTAKEELSQIRELEKSIDLKKRYIEELEEDMTKLKSPSFTERVQYSPDPDKIGALVTKLDSEIRKYNDLVEEHTKIKAELIARIDKIQDPELKNLLFLRYVIMLKWEDIADEMHYSDKWVRSAMHSKALAAFSNISK